MKFYPLIRNSGVLFAVVLWVGMTSLAGWGIYSVFFGHSETPLEAEIVVPVEEQAEESPEPPVEVERPATITRIGIATWYGSGPGECDACFPHYRDDGSVYYVMANGEVLDDTKFTAAYDCSGLYDRVRVKASNGREVVVEITDRIGSGNCEHIDLTKAAFQSLVPLSVGSLNVTIIL